MQSVQHQLLHAEKINWLSLKDLQIHNRTSMTVINLKVSSSGVSLNETRMLRISIRENQFSYAKHTTGKMATVEKKKRAELADFGNQ